MEMSVSIFGVIDTHIVNAEKCSRTFPTYLGCHVYHNEGIILMNRIGSVLMYLYHFAFILFLINMFFFLILAPTCRDIVYRDTYKDPKTGCISRTKVKFRRCEGSCGRHCCKPKKIKTRRIRLFCVDGTNFIYNLPVIRKCGCKRCWRRLKDTAQARAFKPYARTCVHIHAGR